MRSTWIVVAALVIAPGAGEAQQDSVPAPAPRLPWSPQAGLPLLSVLLPGFGQYWQKAPVPGLVFTATAVTGLGLYGNSPDVSTRALPRTPEGQRAMIGTELYAAAGFLSAYESFHRSLPGMRDRGMYAFMPRDESVGSLMTAPFDLRFLGRWTTWLDLVHSGVVIGLLVAQETGPGKQYRPYRARDAFFGTSISYGAGVGEEAAFRGWIYPALYEATSQNFLAANAIQSALFGALHAGSAGPFAIEIGAWAFYEGWLTRRNGWSIRESIFHHFWYDAVAIAATLLTDDRPLCQGCAAIRPPLVLTFPRISFRVPQFGVSN